MFGCGDFSAYEVSVALPFPSDLNKSQGSFQIGKLASEPDGTTYDQSWHTRSRTGTSYYSDGNGQKVFTWFGGTVDARCWYHEGSGSYNMWTNAQGGSVHCVQKADWSWCKGDDCETLYAERKTPTVPGATANQTPSCDPPDDGSGSGGDSLTWWICDMDYIWFPEYNIFIWWIDQSSCVEAS
jgi:hypothetical protein